MHLTFCPLLAICFAAATGICVAAFGRPQSETAFAPRPLALNFMVIKQYNPLWPLLQAKFYLSLLIYDVPFLANLCDVGPLLASFDVSFLAGGI